MRKKIIQSVSCLVLILGFFVFYSNFKSQNNQLIDNPINLSSIDKPNYCLAIRGNGDYQPAHWGAMASVTEKLGLPSAMSGGSSGTISMFILESIAKNPLLANKSLQETKEIASLMLKSLFGFSQEAKNSTLIKSILLLYQQYEELKTKNISKNANLYLKNTDWEQLKKFLTLHLTELPINDQFINLLNLAIKEKNKDQIEFYLQEFDNSMKVFGKFDAKNDANLFFRFGVVSFEKMANYFGKVAGFYSSKAANTKTLQAWKNFVSVCSKDSIGKTWNEITTTKPECNNLFSNLFNTHFSDVKNKSLPELDIAGSKIPVYASTALLVKNEALRYNDEFKKYLKSRNSQYGSNYSINNTEDIVFGYWGSKNKLQEIEKNLDQNLIKNKKFHAIGPASWLEILSLSPAEPGLSNLKPFTAQDGQKYVSAGGWSDLAPTLVLRASGCKNIVYITRQGGDSIFAQGIAKKLLNLDIDWSDLDTSNDKIAQKNGLKNDQGNISDLSSMWSNLYNVANPNSALRVSLNSASAILCTDWNNHDPKKDLKDAVESSFHSPFVINRNPDSDSLLTILQPQTQNKISGCSY